jgi:hypothetical protein
MLSTRSFLVRFVLFVVTLALCPLALGQTRILPLTAGRAPAEGTAQTHWRANPLTVRLTLDAGRPTATGWETITAEIRKSVTDTTTALASVTLSTPTGAGPFDITFTGAQLNQSLAGAPSGLFWLVIYATDDAGETLDILHAGKLTLLEHAASQTAAAPPNVVGPLSKAQADALYAPLAGYNALLARVAALEAASPTVSVYRRPDGTSQLRRPGGADRYLRP